MSPSMRLTAGATAKYDSLRGDGMSFPLGINSEGRNTRIPSTRSNRRARSGLSTRSVATLCAFSRLAAKFVKRLLTIAVKSSSAARRHATSLSILRCGMTYPAAHCRASRTPSSLLAAFLASAISLLSSVLSTSRPSGKKRRAHWRASGFGQSCVIPAD